MSPAIADGWFTEHRIVISPEHGDSKELRGLPSTLVPDAKFELRGNTIIVTGSLNALEQVQELARELDRPLDRLVVNVLGIEFSEEAFSSFIQVRSNPRLEIDQDADLPKDASVTLWVLNSSYPHSALDTKLREANPEAVASRGAEVMLGDWHSLDLPDNIIADFFGNKKLNLKMRAILLPNYDLNFELEAVLRKDNWRAKLRIRDGDTIMLTGASKQLVILVTPNLLR